MRNFSYCPRCGSPTKKCKAFNEGESEFWLECQKCNTYINTYIPQEHQIAVHKDAHKFVGNFGGYGTGKTLTSRQEVYKHIFLTPKGNTLIGANVQSQYEQTIKRDIEGDIPAAFITEASTQKQYMSLRNGHRLLFRPYDDPNKLRSYNLSMFVMVEGSEVKPEAFVQLKSRLRNMAASKPKRDESGKIIYKKTKTGNLIPETEAEWLKGIIESNPDSGWIRSDVLLKSDAIHKHGKIADVYTVLEAERDPAISSHIASSTVNEFIPESFIPDLIKNKAAWWVAKYVYGSFMYAAGLVYPSAMRYICKTFEVPKYWKRIVAYDYGLSDNSVYLFGAIDEMNNLLYIYKEVVCNNKSVEELAELYHEAAKDIPVGGYVCPPIIDPKSAPKRDYDKKSLADHFLEYGITFIPGHISVDARVFRLNTYLESGKIRIMDCCTNLIGELREYKFQQKNDDTIGWGAKPEDKNNHAINPLEWIVMELPANPNQLIYGIYNKQGHRIDTPDNPEYDEKLYTQHIFEDDEPDLEDTGYSFTF